MADRTIDRSRPTGLVPGAVLLTFPAAWPIERALCPTVGSGGDSRCLRLAAAVPATVRAGNAARNGGR